MKITYTKHALKKFKDLAELGILVTKYHVTKAIKKPTRIDNRSDHPKKIRVI